MTARRRVRRVDIHRPPRLGLPRPTPLGWRVHVRLHDGQIPEDYSATADRLAHAWRVHAVRVIDSRPGRVTLLATMRDPLTTVTVAPQTGELLTVRPGKLEDGSDWVMDFRAVPHWLNAGATQSGKSNLANAIIKGIAPQPVALVGLDLKGGVEFTPYALRLSALATTRNACTELLAELLAELVGELEKRMATCQSHGARNVWRLPEPLRPVPIVGHRACAWSPARTAGGTGPDRSMSPRKRRSAEFGITPDGRLFRQSNGGVVGSSTYAQVWRAAREIALTTDQVASPLAARPYDLRHAAVSLWLNAGVPGPTVARRADHSVDVLLRVYANCIDGDDDIANQRISGALI